MEGIVPYVPAHKKTAWISSTDVLEVIRGLAGNGVDKAACWDFTQAVYDLVDRSPFSDQDPTP